MENRGKATRLAAARHFIVIITVLVLLSIILGLVSVGMKMARDPEYHPRALYNTMLSAGIVLAGLLALRWLPNTLEWTVAGYVLFVFVLIALMAMLDYRLYVLELGREYDMRHIFYVPHIGILMTALIAGLGPAFAVALGGVGLLVLFSQLVPNPLAIVAPAIIALVLPFTASLVERLLDEVERHAQRRQIAESSIEIMAHDLGNPLAVLKSSLELMDDPDFTLDQRETLMRTIRRNTESLERLLGEFREIPYLDDGLEPKTVDLKQIVHDVVELYARPMCSKRGQTLDADFEPVKVMGVSSRLSRVVRELLTNASKYTPQGGHIEVTLERDEQRAVLKVVDNGWGINQEDLARVFDRHWRGTTVEEPKVSGKGLGLFICNKIVEAHGGHIGIVSQKDQGTESTVSLPLAGNVTGSPDAIAEP